MHPKLKTKCILFALLLDNIFNDLYDYLRFFTQLLYYIS